ncbi:hypothetical protein MTO96_020647 [Rhipicephalus appendiculatus]
MQLAIYEFWLNSKAGILSSCWVLSPLPSLERSQNNLQYFRDDVNGVRSKLGVYCAFNVSCDGHGDAREWMTNGCLQYGKSADSRSLGGHNSTGKVQSSKERNSASVKGTIGRRGVCRRGHISSASLLPEEELKVVKTMRVNDAEHYLCNGGGHTWSIRSTVNKDPQTR